MNMKRLTTTTKFKPGGMAVTALALALLVAVAANSVTTEPPPPLPVEHEHEPEGKASSNDGVVWTFFTAPLVTLPEFNAAAALKGGSPNASWYNGFIASLPKALITTRDEAAMFLTHADWESVGFQYTREVYCQTNMAACQTAYPANAGGLQTVVYYGRGPLQVTWDYNYIAASLYLYGNYTLRDQPDLVASDPAVGWAAAAWFWEANVHAVAQTFGNTTDRKSVV